MRYFTEARISVPFINTEADGTTTRNWARLSFKPNPGQSFDRRFVKREIRKWVKRALSRTIRTDELRQIVRNVRCSV